MVSSAIASVDAWIQQAEEVLAELREQGLYPSSVPRHYPGILETTKSPSGTSPRAWRRSSGRSASDLVGGS
jgi:hypothetical protein